MSKTHPSCATLNTEKTYFETCAHNRWRFSDFLKHCGPDHERLEAGCKWMQALESIIDEGNAEYRGTAQRLLNRYLDIQHAETYFKTVQPALWDINEFLFHNENAAKRSDAKEVNSLLCDAWVRGLRQASEDTERTECDRLTARRLLNKYSGTDIDKSRISRFIHAFGSKEAAIHITQPAIVINGNGNKATLTATNPTPSVNHTNKKKRGASAPRHANKKRNTASVPRFLEWFRHTWNSLEESKKWHLPVDTAISDPTAAKFRYVEDVLYHNFKDADKELAVHSWVIDTTDISVEQCFSSGAWKMICEQMPPLPKPDGWFLEAIVRYREFNSPSQLLHHLRTTPPFKLDEVDTLDDDEKHGRMWLDDVMRCWSRLLGSSGDLFTRNHKEHWYTTNIWGPVYDQCMGTIAGSYMRESKSLCTSDRKNSSRPHSRKRQLVGHLYDGLLTLDRHEVGAVEHSRTFTSMYDKKWTRDTLKVVKVLHDMLYKLQQSPVPLRGENRPQVQGVVTGGWCCQAWRMVIGGGYMCVLAGDTLREIPGTYDRIDNLFQHLTRFWVLRNVLKDCKKSLNPTVSRTHAEILDFLCEAESSTDIEGSITIPRSVETDCTSDSEEEEGR